MSAAYVLIGAIGGFLGFAGAFWVGLPFWTALALYPLGGSALIVLAALWHSTHVWRVPQDEQGSQTAGVGRDGRHIA